MKLLFLGSGSAFTVGEDNYQCNVLLISDRSKRLLLDCGSDIRFSLHGVGLSACDISDIYISHLHSDHIGGLEYMGFKTLFDPECLRPNLYASQDVLRDLWERSLSGGMRAIDGGTTTLESFFQVHSINRDRYFVWEDIRFELVPVPHVHTVGNLLPTYGLFFRLGNTNIFHTSDTRFSPQSLSPLYQKADLIFHDCETSSISTPVHARYNELCSLPSDIKAKMWLCGYNPGERPDPTQDGFRGFIQRGQTFDFPAPIPLTHPANKHPERQMFSIPDRLKALVH